MTDRSPPKGALASLRDTSAGLLSRGALLARTVRNLHPAQLAFRPLHIARTRLLSSSTQAAEFVAGAPRVIGPRTILSSTGPFQVDLPGIAIELQRARQALLGSQLLVGESVPLLPPQTDFDAPLPKLVLYQQAYLGIVRSLAIAASTEGFEQPEEASSLAVAHIRELVDRVPPGHGVVWDPYPVAMRILNLVAARELLLGTASREDAAFLNGRLLVELARHARWLTATLEVHLLGNHLFTDGAALFVAGCALQAEGSHVWEAVGRAIITRSLVNDVLPDGGHAERSPMYAAIYLDQLEYVIAAARGAAIAPPAGAVTNAIALGRFLLETAHPDGEIPLFGDSALNEAPAPADVAGALGLAPESLRTRLYGPVASASIPTAEGPTVRAFPETGLHTVRSHDTFFVLDAGPLGTSDQPGHAHADALSFELSWKGRRLIVDGGAGLYEADERRAYFRGPFAHSSVSVDGRGSDEVWASWRAGRRATIEPVIHTALDGVHVFRSALVSAWGWKQERLIVLALDRALLVIDRVDRVAPENRVLSHVHFDPGVELKLWGDHAEVRQGEHVLGLCRVLGAGWTSYEGDAAPWRGYSSFHMGEFMPSPEVEIEAATRTNGRFSAWSLIFGEGAETSSTPGSVSLRVPGLELTVATEAALRWELKRTHS